MSDKFFEQPVLNSPYECPLRRWELDEATRQPTDNILDGRRRCELITPVPKGKKQRRHHEQKELELEKNKNDHLSIINDLRSAVASWRGLKDWGVSPETSRLLQHWRQHKEGIRPFFCQIEAVETAIWLAEVAPKNANVKEKFLGHLQGVNDEANPDLFRIALKLATGAGKTTVMAMIMAWQIVNAVRHPQSRSFTKGFLIITPGITIKDRLRVLMPNDPENYYQHRNIVPRDMLSDIHKAQIVITNYHAFIHRDRLEITKVGQDFMQGTGQKIDTKETEGQMIQRVMPNLMGMKNIIVINDEAHHCYRKKPQDEIEEKLKGEEKDEAEKRDKAARLWISGIETVQRKLGVRTVYDLSATPFFLSGSGYREGTLFPWTMSDFSLIDAIECGIVKLPRVPISDNVPEGEMPKFRELWEHIGKNMPKKGRRKTEDTLDPDKLPQLFKTALDALYSHYQTTFELWDKAGIQSPPVFIIVCNNTMTSKLVYDYISGFHRTHEDGSTILQNGALDLFRNYDEHGNRYARPRTLLIDSEQLESDEALDKDFREASSDAIEQFRRELRERGNVREAENITDKALLREVMNTVGKPGRLGADIRCVVSVAMLSEGWDANTVTHILGARAFGTQLLCEQVVGRGLRRRNYDLDENGLLSAEYADIFGIPFDFAGKATIVEPSLPQKQEHIRAVSPQRDELEITFPRVTGYRVALPDERLEAKFTQDSRLELTPDIVGPGETENSAIVGERVMMRPDHLKKLRPSEITMRLTKHLLEQTYRGAGEEPKIHLFSQFQRIVREWLDGHVSFSGGTHPGQLCYHFIADMVCERIKVAIALATKDKEKIEVVLDPFNRKGSTRHVNFSTAKRTWTTDKNKSHINMVACDSEWEAEFCRVVEQHKRVLSYVKNQGLGFEVPYQIGWTPRTYYPDFILKIDDGQRDDPLHLVVEIKGYRREDAKDKANTMNAFWVPGINQLGTYGRWAFAEFDQGVYHIQSDFNKWMNDIFEKANKK